MSVAVSRGRRVETHDAFQAVLLRGRVVERRELVRVDEWGETTSEELPLDRERLVKLAGLAILVTVVVIYIIVQVATASSDPGGGPPAI